MANQNQTQDIILEDATAKIHNVYRWLQLDTSLIMPAKDAVELVDGGVQVGNDPSLFNKSRDVEANFTKLIGNTSINQFTIATGEPFSQPVSIGGFGMMSQPLEGDGLGFATILPVTFNKDNRLQAKVRTENKFIRRSEI